MNGAEDTPKIVSPWHQVPLFPVDGLLSFVCEVPKNTALKMEIATVREMVVGRGEGLRSQGCFFMVVIYG